MVANPKVVEEFPGNAWQSPRRVPRKSLIDLRDLIQRKRAPCEGGRQNERG